MSRKITIVKIYHCKAIIRLKITYLTDYFQVSLLSKPFRSINCDCFNLPGLEKTESIYSHSHAYNCPTIGSDPPNFSWTIKPRMPIIAARPLLSSMARFDSFVSSSNLFHADLKVPLRKSPGNSFPNPGMSFITAISNRPMKEKICSAPLTGIASGP